MTYIEYRRRLSELAEKHRDDHLALRTTHTTFMQFWELQHRDEREAFKLKHRDERLALRLEHNAQRDALDKHYLATQDARDEARAAAPGIARAARALRVCGRRLAMAAQNKMRFPTDEPAEVCEAAIETLAEWDTAHGLNQTRVFQDGHIVTIPVAKGDRRAVLEILADWDLHHGERPVTQTDSE